MSLWSEFLNHQGRPVWRPSTYFPVYEQHFSRFVNRYATIFEIGVYKGGSLQLWKKYFGPMAMIVGIDIDPNCKKYEEEQIHVRIGNQGDSAFLNSLVEEFGPPDLVIDDGSHIQSLTAKSFNCLYPQMPKDAVYLIEDLGTAYWPDYEGGYKRPGTFIEYCKDLIDGLYSQGEYKDFGQLTASMHLYKGVTVFERQNPTQAYAPYIDSTYQKKRLKYYECDEELPEESRGHR